ncbi:MAG TPA: hypothetical protein ENJ33_03475 [Thiothrix sp.]|nr:hypothetical protein [Thiothrix sp.]
MSIRLLLNLSIISLLTSACTPINPSLPEATDPDIGLEPYVPQQSTIPTNTTPYPQDIYKPKLSTQELQRISHQIYLNETSAKPENLIIWSPNEEFPSLGIGHFIWYPAGRFQRFDETFPALIGYLQQKGIRLPLWLINARFKGAPWPNRTAFLRAKNDPEMRELTRILLNTKELQTLFFFDRLHETIPQIAQSVPVQQRQHIINNYNALAQTQGGWYPLIDYINFKGKGLKKTERYAGEGWGLLQVLQHMRPVKPGKGAINEFSRAAKIVLQRRVRNSPRASNEYRWIPGWNKRLDTYKL